MSYSMAWGGGGGGACLEKKYMGVSTIRWRGVKTCTRPDVDTLFTLDTTLANVYIISSMETIFVIAVGCMVLLNIGAFAIFDRRIRAEHKATRKETQEIKTRLTQMRKDLNNIERKLQRPQNYTQKFKA